MAKTRKFLIKNFKVLVFFLGFLILSASAVYAFTGPGSLDPGSGSGSISVDDDGVGIGTSNPAYDLDVTGDINLTGTLYQGGSAFSTGYWTQSGSNIYFTGGNVGIGESNPSNVLHINGSLGGSTPLVHIDTEYTGDGTYTGDGSGLDVSTTRGDGFTDGYIARFRNAVDTKLYIRGDGNVSIGADAVDSWKFYVDSGTSRFYAGNTSTGNGSFIAGTNSAAYLLGIYNDSTSSYDFRFNPGGYMAIGANADSNYSIYIPGNTAYGIRAFGTTMGGRFEDSNSSARVYAGYGSYDIYANGTGLIQATGSMRAPIFYDSNNTSYYINPGSSGTAGKFNGPIEANGSTFGLDVSVADDLTTNDRIDAGSYIRFQYTGTSSNDLCWTDSGAVWFQIRRCSSSIRFKENVDDLNMKGVETLMKLRPVEYDWIEENGGERDFGFIAEEVAEVNPILATYEEDEEGNERVLSVKYNHFTALITKAIQEQQVTIEDQQTKIEELEERIEALENE